MHSATRRAGFSVIELVVFLAAMIVLVAIAAPRLLRTLERERAPTAIEVVDSLSAPVAPGASEELAVRVLDRRGEPVRGRRLDVVSSAAGDSVAPTRAQTDSSGVARFTWSPGPEQGSRTLRITVPGTSLEARIAGMVDAPVPATAPEGEEPAPR